LTHILVKRPRLFKAAKISTFAVTALLALVAGWVGALLLWSASHHRYESPNSGIYYGSVSAVFASFDESVYSLRLQGTTQPEWRLGFPTNFSYRRLRLEWSRGVPEGKLSEGTSTVLLPSLAYDASGRTGVLSQATLNEWLLGHSSITATSADARGVQAIFGYIRAAAEGSLPPPRHHPYRVAEVGQALNGFICHFRLGVGLPGLAYIWFAVWLLLVFFVGRRLWSNHAWVNDRRGPIP
jgi:hypothetical protein